MSGSAVAGEYPKKVGETETDFTRRLSEIVHDEMGDVIELQNGVKVVAWLHRHGYYLKEVLAEALPPKNFEDLLEDQDLGSNFMDHMKAGYMHLDMEVECACGRVVVKSFAFMSVPAPAMRRRLTKYFDAAPHCHAQALYR